MPSPAGPRCPGEDSGFTLSDREAAGRVCTEGRESNLEPKGLVVTAPFAVSPRLCRIPPSQLSLGPCGCPQFECYRRPPRSPRVVR